MLFRRYLRRTGTWMFLIIVILLSFLIIHQVRTTSSMIKDENLSNLDHFENNIVQNDLNRLDMETTSNLNIRSKLVVKESERPSFTKTIQNFSNRNIEPIPHRFVENSITVPLPVINTIGLERFVHLDLKGAAPKISYYEKLFPYLKKLGATGLLIEYEDMFPYTGRLSVIQNGFAYSKSDIERIQKLADENELRIMPLLQVYGHLEYVLKLKEFQSLREDARYPQVITPCLEESYGLLYGKGLERSCSSFSFKSKLNSEFRND